MNTTAIANPVNMQQPARAGAKQPEASNPDAAFNNMLSRQISSRNNAARTEQSQPRSSQNSPAPAAPRQNTESSAAAKTEPGQDGGASDNENESVSTASSSALDMLALVADLNLMNRTGSAATTDMSDETSSDLLDVGTSGNNRASGRARDLLDPALEGMNARTTRDTQVAASAPADDFAAALEQNLSAAASRDATDLKAGALQAKAVDTFTQSLSTVAPAQQAAALAASAATRGADQLAPRVGTSAWDAALSQRVIWMVNGAEQTASLTLNPPDLGPLQVVLNVSNSQANASFITAQPEVRQALEDALPKLREMLSDAGIELGQASVSHGNPGQDNGNRQGFGSENRHAGADAESGAPAEPARTGMLNSGQGLVDTFV